MKDKLVKVFIFSLWTILCLTYGVLLGLFVVKNQVFLETPVPEKERFLVPPPENEKEPEEPVPVIPKPEVTPKKAPRKHIIQRPENDPFPRERDDLGRHGPGEDDD